MRYDVSGRHGNYGITPLVRNLIDRTRVLLLGSSEGWGSPRRLEALYA
jgi:hypothetical protein